MINYKNDLDYGVDRLSGTIATINGLPAWVHNLYWGEHGKKVEASIVMSDTRETFNIEDLDTTPVHTGFINNFKGSYHADYTSRGPHRQWKQGMRPANMVNLTKPARYFTDGSIETGGFVDSYTNRYPHILKCEELLMCDEVKSIAFHKEYKLHKEGDTLNLVHKVYHVGTYNINKVFNGDINLLEDYKFLEDELEEILG